MKALIFLLIVSSAVASANDSFLNSKAGLILSGGNQPTIKQAYSFPVKTLSTHVCRQIAGTSSKCEWKKLDGNGRRMLTRTEVDEVTDVKSVNNIVFEQSGDVVYVTRWVVDGQDYGRRILIEMAKLMANLEDEFKAKKK